MKEKIKALMQQAGTDTSGKWMGVEHAEKLVELIVRECAVIVGSMEEPHQDIAKLVKEHFGVK